MADKFCITTWFILWMFLDRGSSSSQSNYLAIHATNGSLVCGTSPPDSVVPANLTIQQSHGVCLPLRTLCGYQCQSKPRCVGYNYRDMTRTCELFYNVSNTCSCIPGCSYYQIVTLAAVVRKGNVQVPVISPDRCSFPFSYAGLLYYKCISSVADVTDTCYWTYGCLMSNRTWAVCSPTPLATTYLASNSTLSLTIPTFSGTTTVQSLAGWIVFQQRIDGTLAFDQTWAAYKAGFGTYTSNYWMGLEKIYQLTKAGNYKLRMEVFLNSKWTSDEYYSFYLNTEALGYALHVSGYSGENGDVLRWTGNANMWYHNGMKFSTKDVDNDLGLVSGAPSSCNPLMSWTGGWWYNNCWIVNLNENYGSSHSQYYLSGSWYNIQIARMMMQAV